ncbi:MAG: hypothetical protein ACFE8L_12595 [Candidatus Hodarchaeota archaeon]
MPATTLSAVYQHAHLGGRKCEYCALGHERYHIVRRTDLMNVNLYKKISSAKLWESLTGQPRLILFYTSEMFWVSDFNGSYLQITNPFDSGYDVEVDHLSHYNFNDLTTSLFLVNTNTVNQLDYRLSLRDLFLDRWKEGIDEILGNKAKRVGDPILTWEMWPIGISYLDPNRCYIKVYQYLEIEVPDWFNYDASIKYHIYLYLDNSGRIRGYAARWAYWVESGIFSGKIARELEPKVISGMDKINEVLSTTLEEYSGYSLCDLYYLPGRQLDYIPSQVRQGSTHDDITIVAVLG